MAFSGTLKCQKCGTVYHKGQNHTCPVPCSDCGVKVYDPSIHTCDPKRYEEHQVEKFNLEMKGAELTPRMRRYQEFLQWCRDEGRE